MPGKRIFPLLVITGFLVIMTAEAAPKWDCQPGPEGDWLCAGDGQSPQPELTVQEGVQTGLQLLALGGGTALRRHQAALGRGSGDGGPQPLPLG